MRRMTVACCHVSGLSLRAIGDKRAIPGLIRSIPKTLRSANGSDMGLEGGDATLVKFMQQNGLDKIHKDNPFNQGNRYSFGRPIREIFGALEGLSGQKFDEEELYHMFSGGSANQERQKRKLFNRTASQWALWWEQHWAEHVQDVTYSHVNLARGAGRRPHGDGPTAWNAFQNRSGEQRLRRAVGVRSGSGRGFP